MKSGVGRGFGPSPAFRVHKQIGGDLTTQVRITRSHGAYSVGDVVSVTWEAATDAVRSGWGELMRAGVSRETR